MGSSVSSSILDTFFTKFVPDYPILGFLSTTLSPCLSSSPSFLTAYVFVLFISVGALETCGFSPGALAIT
jgi:hypothetical protein